MQPEDEGVMATYGRVLAMSGKVEEAKEQLRKAVEVAEKKSQEQLVEQVFLPVGLDLFGTSSLLDLDEVHLYYV